MRGINEFGSFVAWMLCLVVSVLACIDGEFYIGIGFNVASWHFYRLWGNQ